MPEHQLSKEQEQPIVQKRTSNNDGKTVQRAEREAVSPFGGKSFWHKSNAVIQGKGGIGYPAVPIFGKKQPIQQKADTNNTGLPDNLKSGIENLSGYSMDDVKVHYNSDKPAQLQAHAFAQGTDIHLGAGQEKHLAHEAWHVVQQKQGRVKPTVQMKGKMNVNDDKGLEREADVMGAKALQMKSAETSFNNTISNNIKNPVVQGYFKNRNYRIADDLSIATKDSDPWKNGLYAKSNKITASNNALKAVGASIELNETTTEETFSKDATSVKLKQVEIKNKVNNTEGNNMKLYADCGRSNSLVVGSLKRSATYNDKDGKTAQTTHTSEDIPDQTAPEMMKYEIMLNHFKDEIAKSGKILTTIAPKIKSKNAASKNLKPFEGMINKYENDIKTLQTASNIAIETLNNHLNSGAFDMKTFTKLQKEAKKTKEASEKKIQEYQEYLKKTKDSKTKKSVKKLLDKYRKENKHYTTLVNTIMAPYKALSDVDKDAFDKKVGINKYANPSVGGGYTMSSGGENYANKNTWNYHWGGVIMESDDKKDKVTLENFSVSNWNLENKEWSLQMYGTEKEGQTFHEQHKATQEHGKTPTTLNIKKQ